MDKNDLSWCARCGRLVCSSCLGVDITEKDIALESASTLHSICFDCASHLVDVMNPTDIRSRQSVLMIIQRLNIGRYLAELSNIASELQDQIILLTTGEDFGPRPEQIRNEITLLEERRVTLENEIQRAREEAENARRQNVASSHPAASKDDAESDWSLPSRPSTPETQSTCTKQLDRCAQLRRELQALIRDGPAGNTEEESTAFVCRREELALLIDNAEYDVALNMSATISSSVDSDLPSCTDDTSSQGNMSYYHDQDRADNTQMPALREPYFKGWRTNIQLET